MRRDRFVLPDEWASLGQPEHAPSIHPVPLPDRRMTLASFPELLYEPESAEPGSTPSVEFAAPLAERPAPPNVSLTAAPLVLPPPPPAPEPETVAALVSAPPAPPPLPEPIIAAALPEPAGSTAPASSQSPRPPASEPDILPPSTARKPPSPPRARRPAAGPPQPDRPIPGALEAYEKEDFVEAYRLWSRAAAAGNREARYRLGILYTHGQGVVRNAADAMAWFRRAAWNRAIRKLSIEKRSASSISTVAPIAAR